MKLLARVLFTLGSRLPCGLAPPREDGCFESYCRTNFFPNWK
ncbi:DECR1 isoform 7 [Pongo abelii]|uniref:DECR1 isoform 2 n=1 Tax=Pongo abelii TaxID=9601 RepID=A0A2J8UFZ0_PONAB|nr:DECR1 isoform 2 [Pongo abelii]PNJ44190.1 DECR1 isoform 4 [Pongo abelii]PNJ44192.1 DECR1 isoform 7 [Pongo abelii]